MSMTLDTLHPDITRIVTESKRKALSIIDPSPGLWGGDPIEGLITIVYQCDCDPKYRSLQPGHTVNSEHHMLFGPRVIHFSDDCKNCGQSRYRKHEGHTYEEMGKEELDREHYTLYAD